MFLYLLILPIVFAYFAYKKYKQGNNLAFFVLLFYAIGGLFGYIMTQHEFFRSSLNKGYQDIALGACVYLVVGYLILIWPIMKSKTTVDLNVNYPIQAFYWIAFVTAIIGLIYCIFTAPYISLALNASDFSRYKEDILEKGGLDVSGGNHLLNLLFYLQTVIRPFLTFLFCYVLAKYPTRKWLIILFAFAALVPPIFNSLGAAHRNIVVFLAFEMIVGFAMFGKYYTTRIKRMFYSFGIIAGSLTIFIVVYFAFLRFSSIGSSFMEYNFLRYLGEPFVDFNTMLWGTENLMDGNKCFPAFREWLGYKTIDQMDLRVYNAKYIPYFFYGVIGNFYMDFGPVISLVLVLIIGIVFNALINRRHPHNPLSIKMLLFIYSVAIIKNYFYFEYMGGGNYRLLWFIAFFLLFQLILQPVRKRKSTLILSLDDFEQKINRNTSSSVPSVQGK